MFTLSLFPGLLYLAPLATTLVRVAAGCTLLYMAYRYMVERDDLERAKFWPVGHIPEWLTILGSAILFISGLMLVIGLYTQGVAIVGMLIALKHVIFARRYPKYMAISGTAAALLFVICFSLLLSGAGAWGVDLPL
ncbi:MAG: hypothetical protein P4L81_00900 [Candidatus Pacebacteria bacterium]|nr:hypothetical protein [Candidatus Paceibacterota bacterium]